MIIASAGGVAGLSRSASCDGFQSIVHTNVFEALQDLRDTEWDAVVLELPVAGWSGEELLEEVRRAAPAAPCLVQGAPGDDWAQAVRLTKLGAYSWLPATASAGDRLAGLEAAFSERVGMKRKVAEEEPWRRFLVGDTAAMRHVVDTIRLVGPRRSTVLITGETGTGKEMAARALHAASSRGNMPMVAVNCSALPENLLEAELFGHVRGAFTGAVQGRVGRFEQAEKGTIFLDEVAEMPLDLQAKLLRVLQEREFQRLGSSETIKLDVRVIAACNVDLEDRIRRGKFREDLFYRLNVVPLRMPALRERTRDIPLLVSHFLDKVCAQEGIPLKQVAPETLERLMRYSWPGNVRQLENAVEMAAALSGDRDSLFPSDFPLPSVASEKIAPLGMVTQLGVPDEGLDFEQTVGSIEIRLLEQALRKTAGNKKAAADLLRLKRTTLTAKLKSLQALAARAGMAATAF
jgi:DNA-binding NtrC family response regulator